MRKILLIITIMALGFSSLVFAGYNKNGIISKDGRYNDETPASSDDADNQPVYENRKGEYFFEFLGGMAGSTVSLGAMYYIGTEYCKNNPDPQCGLAALYALPAMPLLAGAGVYGAGSLYHANGSYTATLVSGYAGFCSGQLLNVLLVMAVDEINPDVLIYCWIGSYMVGSTVGAMIGYHKSISAAKKRNSDGALLSINNDFIDVSFPAVAYLPVRNNKEINHTVYIQLLRIAW